MDFAWTAVAVVVVVVVAAAVVVVVGAVAAFEWLGLVSLTYLQIREVSVVVLS